MAIIPAHNESSMIGEVVRNSCKYVSEVVVVDDCSTDDTARIARKEGAKVIKHIYNTGVGGALRTGYRYCLNSNCDLVVQLDSDGQHDPAYIPVIVNHLINGESDIVTGSRFLNESHKEYSVVRRAGIRFFSGVVKAVGHADLTDITSGFRAYRIDAIKALFDIEDKHWAVDQTLRALILGFKYEEVAVEMPKRLVGKSQFTPSTFFLYPISMFKVISIALIFKRRHKTQ